MSKLLNKGGKVRRYNLPINENYKLIDSFYTGGLDNATVCDNCGKPIANVAVIKNSKEELFNVGLDCAETLTNLEGLYSAKMDFEELKSIQSKIRKLQKEGKEISYEININGDLAVKTDDYTVLTKDIIFANKYLKKYIDEVINPEKIGFSYVDKNITIPFEYFKPSENLNFNKKWNIDDYNVVVSVKPYYRMDTNEISGYDPYLDVDLDGNNIYSKRVTMYRNISSDINYAIKKYLFEKYNNQDGSNPDIRFDKGGETKNKIMEKQMKMKFDNNYEDGGVIYSDWLKDDSFQEEFNYWMEDDNVIKNPDGTYSTQDAQYRNSLKDMSELQMYFYKEFIKGQYAEGGEADSFGKGGNVSSIEKRVEEVNKLIELANANDISVIDSSVTWESPMKYKPVRYSNGVLYVEYQELDLYKYNRTGESNWVTKKDKVLKRNMEFDNQLNDIAKMYRKALREENIDYKSAELNKKEPEKVSEKQEGFDDAGTNMVMYHEAKGNFMIPKGQIYLWLYEGEKIGEKLQNEEYDYVFYPYSNINMAFQKGFIPPLKRIWTKKFQKDHKGSEHLLGVIKAYLIDKENGEKELYVDMMSVNTTKQKKGIMSYMIKELRDTFNLTQDQVTFSKLTPEGEKFVNKGKYEDGGEMGGSSDSRVIEYEMAETVAKRFDKKEDAQNWINENSKYSNSKFRIEEVPYDSFIDYRVMEKYERRKMADGGVLKVGSKVGFLRPRTGRYEYAEVLSIDGDNVNLVVRHPKRSQWDNYFTETKKRITQFSNTFSEDYDRPVMKVKYADGGEIESEINELYSKSNFINNDFNWQGKLLEMLQDNSVEAFNVYQSLTDEQKEEVLQELYEIDNDMGSYGDGDIETSKENLIILLEGAKNGNKYGRGGFVGLKVRRKNLSGGYNNYEIMGYDEMSEKYRLKDLEKDLTISATDKELKNDFEFVDKYEDGGEAAEYQIIDKKTEKYYSLSMSDGKIKWNDSPDMGYMFTMKDANTKKESLLKTGYEQVEVVKYDSNWWQKAKYEKGGAIYPDLSLQKAAVVNDSVELNEFEIKKMKNTFQINGMENTKITSSQSAVKILRELFSVDTINAFEEAYILYLNRNNKVIGYYHHSSGGIDGTVMDVQMISGMALKSLAKGVIIAHNHPSENTQPSDADKRITNQLKDALKLFNIYLMDSIILTNDSFFSFADDGLL